MLDRPEQTENAVRLAGDHRVFALRMGATHQESKWAAEPGWQASASSDPEVVRHLWSGRYRYNNPGIALREEEAFLDFDVAKGGLITLAWLDLEYDLPHSRRVRTPTGGVHVYFTLPPGVRVPNGVVPIAELPGMDVRSLGGLVVGPGSVTPAGSYDDLGGVMEEMPGWMIEWLLRAKPMRRLNGGGDHRAEVAAFKDWDRPEAKARAREWLLGAAPGAIEGQGGDLATWQVCAELRRGYGLSEGVAFDLLWADWNFTEKVDPPWSADDLRAKVRGGLAYGSGPMGGNLGVLDFAETAAEIAAEEAPWRKKWAGHEGRFEAADLEGIEPRAWVYGYKLIRKYVAIVGGPGGVSKTSWAIAVALSMASGRRLLHDQPLRAMKVWFYNLEDDIKELKRRFKAAIMHFGLPVDEVMRNLILSSGRDVKLKIADFREDKVRPLPDMELVIERMLEEQIDLLIIDPLLHTHSAPENSNEAQDVIMRLYTQIADRANAAVMLLHHTSKHGEAGTVESLRGATAQGWGARTVMLPVTMTTAEAKALSIDERMRRRYVQVHDGKANMSPPVDKAEWIYLHSVMLGNPNEEYPEGDNVQAAGSWTPPSAWEGVGEEDALTTLKRIEEGPGEGERYSIRPQDADRWAGAVVMDYLDRTKPQAVEILKGWMSRGLIEVRNYRSEKQRKERQGVFVHLKTEGMPE